MTKCSILIKTNSAYSYLWPIINDFVEYFPKINLITDSNSNNFSFNKNIEVGYYDINDSYATRLLKFIPTLNTKYLVLIHDIDLIINFNLKKLSNYVDLIEKYNIQRLSFGVFNGSNIIEKNNLKICKLFPNMSKNFFTPFDYAPSIFEKQFLINLYSTFCFEKYQTMELNPSVQDYVTKMCNAYGIQNNQNIKLVYHRGFVYTEDFNFLHLTVKGKMMHPTAYYDLKDKFYEIYQKYNLNFSGTEAYIPPKNEL